MEFSIVSHFRCCDISVKRNGVGIRLLLTLISKMSKRLLTKLFIIRQQDISEIYVIALTYCQSGFGEFDLIFLSMQLDFFLNLSAQYQDSFHWHEIENLRICSHSYIHLTVKSSPCPLHCLRNHVRCVNLHIKVYIGIHLYAFVNTYQNTRIWNNRIEIEKQALIIQFHI